MIEQMLTIDPPPLVEHVPADFAQVEERTVEVDGHDPVPGLHVELLGRDAAQIADPRVVDEHVDPAVRLDPGGDDAAHVGLDRNVAGTTVVTAAPSLAARLRDALEQLGAAGGEDQVGSGVGEGKWRTPRRGRTRHR